MPTTHLPPDSAPGRSLAEPQSGASGATNIATSASRAGSKAALLALARALGRQAAREAWEAQHAPTALKEPDHG